MADKTPAFDPPPEISRSALFVSFVALCFVVGGVALFFYSDTSVENVGKLLNEIRQVSVIEAARDNATQRARLSTEERDAARREAAQLTERLAATERALLAQQAQAEGLRGELHMAAALEAEVARRTAALIQGTGNDTTLANLPVLGVSALHIDPTFNARCGDAMLAALVALRANVLTERRAMGANNQTFPVGYAAERGGSALTALCHHDVGIAVLAVAAPAVGEQRRLTEAFKLAFGAAHQNLQPDAAKLAALLPPLPQRTPIPPQ